MLTLNRFHTFFSVAIINFKRYLFPGLEDKPIKYVFLLLTIYFDAAFCRLFWQFIHQSKWDFNLRSAYKHLTLSWRRSLSYRNQSIDLLWKSITWVLYDRDICHERVNLIYIRLKLKKHNMESFISIFFTFCYLTSSNVLGHSVPSM